MKDYIDIQERPSWGRMLPLSFQHLFAMFGSTVLVPYLLKVDPATALFMNGIGTLLYLFVCKGKIPAYLGSSFAFIAPVAGVLSAGLGYEAAKGAFVVFGLSFVILSILVRYIGTRWIDKLFPPAAMGAIVAIIGLELAPVAMSMSGLIGNQDLGMSHSYFYLYVFLSCYLAWYCCVPWLLSCNPCFDWRCFRLYLVCLHGSC